MSNKNNFKVILSGLFIFVLSFPVHAQNEIKSLNEISKKMYKDLGGVVIVSQMNLSIQGFEMMIDSKIYKNEGKSRTENTITGIPGRPDAMQVITIEDGKDLWMISADRGKEKVNKNDPMAKMGKSAFDSGIPEDSKYLRTEKVGERECYVIETTVQTQMGSSVSTMWYDKKTASLVKGETQSVQGKMTTKVDEFKKLKNKWEIPFKITGNMEGSPMMIANITSIEIDQKLSEDLFNADKAENK